MSEDPNKMPYSQMLREVKEIVDQLSADSIDVDDMAHKVEKGFTMINTMKQRLNETKDKIEDLYQKFDDTDDSSAPNS